MLHAMIIIDPEANRSTEGRADAALTVSALRLFLRRARQAVPVAGQVSVLLTSDSAIRRLNGKFRGKHRPTDVISFPALAMPAQKTTSRQLRLHPPIAGDLAISLDAAAHQALRFGHPLLVELKILMLHGLLHLAGYDHETDAGEMAAREEQLRRRFRLSNTLIARSMSQAAPPPPPAIRVPRASRARTTGDRKRAGRP
ncbi:MAG TPA: rRNA maturation RNase YbeY [Acidobacteriaceae bacterium]|nr:rRNA maturation RNase YbeY [Acidobacteriaceae bacterium]